MMSSNTVSNRQSKANSYLDDLITAPSYIKEEMNLSSALVSPKSTLTSPSYTSKDNAASASCRELLRKIGMYDFVAMEAAMFLNTHPNDKVALDYFKTYCKKSKEAKEEYAARCGPIEICQSGRNDTWDWLDSPWPWEGGRA